MAQKTVEIDAALDPMLRDLIDKAEPAVEEVLGSASDRVQVAWTRGSPDTSGEATARVSFTEEGIRRTADLTAWDLEDDVLLRRRLRGVLWQVLQERLGVHLQRLRELAEAEED